MNTSLIAHFAAALLAIMNPLGNLPVYISATSGERPGTQKYLALFLSLFIAAFLCLFFWTGSSILHFFGISLPAFRIAGGILLLLTGIGMVQGRETQKIEAMAHRVDDISDLKAAEHRFRNLIIPVGIPLFVGPGSISTVILFAGHAEGAGSKLILTGVILGMSLLTFFILLLSDRAGKFLGPMGMDIAARILGLILTAIGIQFVLGGLAEVTVNVFDQDALKS